MEEQESFWMKHKNKVYLVGALVVGVAVGGVAVKNGDVIVNGLKQTNIAMLGGKNVVTTELPRRGHPGFVVRHLESGEVAASMARLAEILGVSRPTVAKMVAEGTVEVLGEAR